MKGFTYTPEQKKVIQVLIDYLYDSGKRSSSKVANLIAELSAKIGAVPPLSYEQAFEAYFDPAKLNEYTTVTSKDTFAQFGYALIGDLYTGSIERLAIAIHISQN